ncbi:membrane protein [Mycolicibacterium litorale]|uniref:Membrane protein n=2 Tax=Mycolicibacterium litorale TaxID=758802 RepID=A0AAD1MPV6_9MYCO|nr:membrane protein [Mycolicibacterium litorale]
MAVQGAALFVGAGYLLLGALGFLPGVTTDHDALRWAGHDSDALLFGVFAVSGLHNTLHLVLGAAGMFCARTYAASRAYLLAGGVILLGMWIYRAASGHSGIADLFPLNRADNWLHFALGAVMVILALTLAAQHDPTKPRSRARARSRAKSGA